MAKKLQSGDKRLGAGKKLLRACFCVILLEIALAALFFFWERVKQKESSENQITVDLNEIIHQVESGENEAARQNLEKLKKAANGTEEGQTPWYPILFCGAYILITIGIGVYVYLRILRPFDRLQGFAGQVATGNLDAMLLEERGQYFGQFTWAFDNMRNEIKKSKEAEKTAIENNKTVIATLSHDIKTPISSIRTYCEALEANLDKTPEKRSKYLNTIMEKCDEVGRLTDDLFLHSVSEMNRLSVTPVKTDFSLYLKQAAGLLDSEDKITFTQELGEKESVFIDPARMTQILENLVANAGKYAKTKVEIHAISDENTVTVTVRDFGPGVCPENLPFITQKFYRGNNVEGIAGSGLGLYICAYLADKMKLKLEFSNVYEQADASLDAVCRGFLAKIEIPKIS